MSAALALRAAIGAHPAPSDEMRVERAWTEVRAILGREPFGTAWAEGQALDLERAVALALGEIGPA